MAIRAVIAVTAALLLPGCAATTSSNNIAVGLLEPQVTVLEAGLRSIMKDPESARFGPYWAAQKPDGTTIICGLVNGRNSFGGYTGDKPYLAGLTASNEFGGAKIGSDETSSLAIIMTCRQVIPGFPA